jgi:hypothetical protein
MKTKHFLVIGLILTGAGFISAQTDTQVSTDTNEDLLSADERARVNSLRNQFGLLVNQQDEDIRLNQIGNSNQADLQLIQQDLQDRSRLAVTQTGGEIGNKVNFQLSGSGVEATVLQLGDNNLYNANLSGNAQSLDIIQEGFNNEIQHNAILDSGAEIELLQLGNDNYLDADGISRSIQVTQRNGGRVTLSELD